MRNIDKFLLLLISSINLDPELVNYKSVVNNWRMYSKCWPDDSRAMKYLYGELARQLKDEYNNDLNQVIIKLGQCMENLSWSFKKIREKK